MVIETRFIYKGEARGLIVNNIALKDGDCLGSKNISRMRTAIVSQHEFLNAKNSDM